MPLAPKDFERWLSAYGDALSKGDVDTVLGLFSEDAHYREGPFDAPRRGQEDLRTFLEKELPPQDDPVFDFEIICVSGESGWAQWTYRFTREGTDDPVRINGVLKAALSEKKCTELQQWQNRLEPGQGDLMRDFDA